MKAQLGISRFCLMVASIVLATSASAQIKFEDVSQDAGVHFITVPDELVGGGVVVFDYDNDGLYDMYIPGGDANDGLFRNNGDGTFRFTATSAGIKDHGNNNTHGGAAFDYDNDGYTDLYLTVNRSGDILYHNNGNDTFTNVTLDAGIIQPLGVNDNMTATFGDFDGDGDNDLYVARWIDTNRTEYAPDGTSVTYKHVGLPNYFYINNGDGTFREASKEYGLDDRGTSLIAIFADYDLDGDLDLIIGNDFGVDLEKNRIYKNLLVETGEAKFVEVSKEIGLNNGLFCMGIGMADYDHDGDFDFYETNIGPEALMQNNGGMFTDVSKQAGVGKGTMIDGTYLTTTWSPVWVDLNNNTWEDLFVVHGQMPVFKPRKTDINDTTRIYENMGDGSFTDRTDSSGFVTTAMGRSAIGFDYDNDGRVDIIYNQIEKPPPSINPGIQILHNVTRNVGNWINLKMVGKHCGREAIGTTLKLWLNGKSYMKQVTTGGSYLSQAPLIQHFGLGSATQVDSVVVSWPAERLELGVKVSSMTYTNLAVNALNTITEGDPVVSVSRSVRTSKDNLQIFPQPALSALHVKNVTPGAQIAVIDMLGRTILTSTNTSSTAVLDIHTLAAGVYTLRISHDGVAEVHAFVKQ